ncbi:MAG: hypothetical protein US36_C0003G0043 [Candidatus Wolfebacteria bacterium GW2011_GWC1_37_10]|uniref:Uncharacterized protein n=1 Tax=Candidatus Wolfebacteria bacterium GW2011_GWC1_37_10 TaxID=1619010 RepID=A0A0G0IG90_9BACT|nr:MAG: hypothetical protein US36_C0003G0043 [Candidatus Wolfebacteria bacterium GW2011_GWC1_37_10]
MAKRFPVIWEFKISEKGISIGLPDGSNEKFYSLKDLKSFDIHESANESDEYKELIFKTNSRFYPFIKLNFYLKDEEKIESFLLNFLPKEEHPGSLVDSLIKLIGF